MLKWFLSVLATLVLTLGLLIVWAYEPDRPLSSLRARWAPPPSTFIQVAGVQVHVRDEGPVNDPMPIVLIHGTSASLHTWDGWAHALTQTAKRRVIRFDLPGIGLSGPMPLPSNALPGQAPDYSGEAYARFTVQLLQHLGVAQAVLAGNSLGGEVAWRTAVLAPQLVQSLILVDSAGPAFVPKSVPLGFALARNPAFTWITEHLLTRALVKVSITSVYGNPQRVTPELVDRYFELTLHPGNRRALTQRLQSFVPGRGIDGLKQIHQPTLVMWGGQDRLIPPEVAQEFLSRIPTSRLVVYEDLGHVPHEEDPQRTVRDAMTFLSSSPSFSTGAARP